MLLNDGSKHISILDWRTNTTLIQRVEMGRRHSRRCLLMSLALAKTASDKVCPLVLYPSMRCLRCYFSSFYLDENFTNIGNDV